MLRNRQPGNEFDCIAGFLRKEETLYGHHRKLIAARRLSVRLAASHVPHVCRTCAITTVCV